MKYIVVSEKNGRGSYKMFDNEAEARDFLNIEEYDFCERTLYTDFDEFVEDWCYADENNGTWDERLEQYTDLFDKTDWQGGKLWLGTMTIHMMNLMLKQN